MASEIPLRSAHVPVSVSKHFKMDQGNLNPAENIVNNPCTDRLMEIPLLPLPALDYKNLGSLETTLYVNVVLENEGSQSFFRVSDDKNQDVFCATPGRIHRAGVMYLKCTDLTNSVVLLIGYPVGLGEVALLSPKEELIGECQSNVEFQCLSVKVKYNFYDANGNRLMKMMAFIPDNRNEGKFALMVKRPRAEKLALIKMGRMEKCCHIKFKRDVATVADRLQIIALWIGFMHNQMEDKVGEELSQRREAMKKSKLPVTSQLSQQIENNNLPDTSVSHEGNVASSPKIATEVESPASLSHSQPSDMKMRVMKRLKSLVNATFPLEHGHTVDTSRKEETDIMKATDSKHRSRLHVQVSSN